MTACALALRRCGRDAATMEEAAQRIVRYLHEHLRDGRTGAAACPLVRFFKTHPHADLEEDLRGRVWRQLGVEPEPALKCLVLLASAGDRPEWNDRHLSLEHQVIPLASPEMVERFPMIAQLVGQFGLEVQTFLRPTPSVLLDQAQRSYNVFHVPEAVGCPAVPAQDEFVRPWGIRSVLGFGGVLPDGDLFVVILFARVAIAANTAELFKSLALSVKLAVLSFGARAVFAGRTPAGYSVA
jgi:hypothetical protein